MHFYESLFFFGDLSRWIGAHMKIAFSLLLLFVSTTSFASTDFPTAIEQHLSLDAVPSCTLCHTNTPGQAGTVTQPFGVNLRENYQVIPRNIALLQSALDDVEANGDDSDGDGVGDIQELRDGTDPNVDNSVPGPEQPETITPEYGFFCGASMPNQGPVWVLWLLLLARKARRKMAGIYA